MHLYCDICGRLSHSLIEQFFKSGKWIITGSRTASASSHQKDRSASTFTPSRSSTRSFRSMRSARRQKWMENWFQAAMNKLLKRRGDMSDLNLTGKGKVRAQFSQNSSFWIFGYENVFREQSNMANTGFSILTKTFLNTNVFDNAG